MATILVLVHSLPVDRRIAYRDKHCSLCGYPKTMTESVERGPRVRETVWTDPGQFKPKTRQFTSLSVYTCRFLARCFA